MTNESPKNPLKYRGATGILYTRALFFEMTADKTYCLYTLKDEDHESDGIIYPSLRRLYLELGDETEYLFAEKYFLNYPHLQKLLQVDWFKNAIEGWRHELKLKNTALGLKVLQEKAAAGDIRAAKDLVTRPWDKSPPGAGRPSKKAIQEEAQKLIKDNNVYDEDFERIIQGSTIQ